MSGREPRSWWIDKAQTAFGKRSVNGIPEWVADVGSPRLTFRRGKEEYIKLDGKSHLRWYFAPDFITFFLLVHSHDDLRTLNSRLSQPRYINPKGKGGAITFRVYHDRDLDVVKEMLLQRIGRLPQADTNDGHSRNSEPPVHPANDASPEPSPEIASSGADDEMVEWFEGDEEGRERLRLHRQRERSRKNREAAVRIHGTTCKVCGFDFNRFYGESVARNYIEVHHIRPLAEHVGVVNPETDLIPLCSNCHSMVHRNPSRTLAINELREQIRLSIAEHDTHSSE